jgi:hypothetical protein
MKEESSLERNSAAVGDLLWLAEALHWVEARSGVCIQSEVGGLACAI